MYSLNVYLPDILTKLIIVYGLMQSYGSRRIIKYIKTI